MVHGRRFADQVDTRLETSRRYPSVQRRTDACISCGAAFFCLLLTLGCTTSPPTVASESVLRIGVPEAVAGNEFVIRNIANLSVEGLSQLKPDGRPSPKLAESWTWENDGLVLRVNLRRDVTFHDGTPLTAPRAAEILQRAITQPSNRTLYTSFADIKEVRAETDLQLSFVLFRPSAFLPEDLELPLQLAEPMVGTGPYKVVRSDASGMELESNPDYYLGKPQIERVILRPFPALRTAWASLLRGEVDTVTNVPPEAVEFVNSEDVQVVSSARRYQYAIAFNSKRPPFDSPIVRRALNNAVDRAALVRGALRNRGEPSTGPLWPQHWAYDTSLPSFGFDSSAAVSLLESAGYGERPVLNGPPARFRFTCLIPENFSVAARVGLEVQKQLYDIGVAVQFETISAEAMGVRIGSGNFEAVLIDMVGGPTLGRAYMFWGSARSFQGLNVFGYENPEAERLFTLLRTTTNEAAIRSATPSLQRVFLDDPPALFLAWNQRSRAVRREFQIVHDDARDPADPLFTIWRWTHSPATE